MNQHMTLGRVGLVGGALAAVAAAAFVASCGGGGSDTPGLVGSGQAATIDTAAVDGVMADASSLVTICKGSAQALNADSSLLMGRAMAGLKNQRMVRLGLAPNMRAQAYGSTKPADTLGSCGGRFGYPSYSHTNGVTTATLLFSDYCRTNSDTGHQEIMSGSVSFVNTATPTANGPITSKWEGSSAGVTTKVVKSDGTTVVSSGTVGFDSLVYAVGVPGGSPTAASPDTVTASQLKLTNNVNGKSYVQTNYRLAAFDTSTGGQQVSFSGRGYRSNGDYYDISTTTPLTLDASDRYIGGALTFTGANSSNAVATVVPGSALQVNLTVNGTPVTSVPACQVDKP